MQEPLQYMSVKKWTDLQNEFKLDFPRSLMGYYVLETHRRLLQEGLQYDFKVYCPYGDASNGMVAVNKKSGFYEIIIHCPKDDTKKLEDAVLKTKIIKWYQTKILPAAPNHILDCLKSISSHINLDLKLIVPCIQFVMDKTSTLFADIRLPAGITFGRLSLEHVNLVDSVWPHRYPESEWYFEKLISSKCGYGLFKENVLLAWIFIFDIGALGHLYVIEEHRRKGYAELILKLICNLILDKDEDVFSYVLKTNVKSYNLFKKLGFKITNDASWVNFQTTNE